MFVCLTGPDAGGFQPRLADSRSAGGPKCDEAAIGPTVWLHASTDSHVLNNVRWGVVLIGAAAGLFAMVLAGLVVFVVAAALGASPDDLAPLIALASALFAGQFLAGYTAGRFTTGNNPAYHGSLAALLLYGVVSTLSLAAGSPATPFTLGVFAAVALVIGLAGGVLAARPPDEDVATDESDGR